MKWEACGGQILVQFKKELPHPKGWSKIKQASSKTEVYPSGVVQIVDVPGVAIQFQRCRHKMP